MKLYRAFSEQEFAEKFMTGELLIRHLDYYRELEGDDNSHKRDSFEGVCIITEDGEENPCYSYADIFLVCTSLYSGINTIRERHGKFIVQINDHERFADLLNQWGLNERRKMKPELEIDKPGANTITHRSIDYYDDNKIPQHSSTTGEVVVVVVVITQHSNISIIIPSTT